MALLRYYEHSRTYNVRYSSQQIIILHINSILNKNKMPSPAPISHKNMDEKQVIQFTWPYYTKLLLNQHRDKESLCYNNWIARPQVTKYHLFINIIFCISEDTQIQPPLSSPKETFTLYYDDISATFPLDDTSISNIQEVLKPYTLKMTKNNTT